MVMESRVFILHPYENRHRQYTRSVSRLKLVTVLNDVLGDQQPFHIVGLSLDATFTNTPMHNMWKSYKRTLETIVGAGGVEYLELERSDVDLAAQSYNREMGAVWGKSLQLAEPFSINDSHLFILFTAMIEKYKPEHVIDVCLGKKDAYSDVARVLNARLHGGVRLSQVDLSRIA